MVKVASPEAWARKEQRLTDTLEFLPQLLGNASATHHANLQRTHTASAKSHFCSNVALWFYMVQCSQQAAPFKTLNMGGCVCTPLVFLTHCNPSAV